MNRSTIKACLVLAAASLLAAACATETPPSDTQAAPGAVSGTPGVPARSSAVRQPPAQRGASVPSAAQAAPKGMPGQRSVYYEFDRSDIKPEFRPAIDAHARYLREHAGARITVEGNGDERGSREYNLALGQKRAESVRQTLRLSGAADEQIEAVSFGEEKPKALGHDEASWAENRRSDFVYRRGE
jgi:peptidoglycan-associated lipoprotein